MFLRERCAGHGTCPTAHRLPRHVLCSPMSEKGSNSACTTAVTCNPVTQGEKHQKIDAHLMKLQNLFHLRVATNLTQTRVALQPLTMGTIRGGDRGEDGQILNVHVLGMDSLSHLPQMTQRSLCLSGWGLWWGEDKSQREVVPAILQCSVCPLSSPSLHIQITQIFILFPGLFLPADSKKIVSR